MFPPVVRAIILNEEGQILMTRHKGSDGTWVLPGGHVESGESLHDALIRELDEELGLPISFLPPEEEDILTSKGQPLTMLPPALATYRLSYKSPDGKDKSRTEYIFLAIADGTIDTIQKEEIEAYKWMDADTLIEGKEKTYECYIQLLEKLLYDDEEEGEG